MDGYSTFFQPALGKSAEFLPPPSGHVKRKELFERTTSSSLRCHQIFFLDGPKLILSSLAVKLNFGGDSFREETWSSTKASLKLLPLWLRNPLEFPCPAVTLLRPMRRPFSTQNFQLPNESPLLWSRRANNRGIFFTSVLLDIQSSKDFQSNKSRHMSKRIGTLNRKRRHSLKAWFRGFCRHPK